MSNEATLEPIEMRDAAKACRIAVEVAESKHDAVVWSEMAVKLEQMAASGDGWELVPRHRATVANTPMVVQGHDEGITLQAIITEHDAAIGDLFERVSALEEDT